MNIQVEKIVLPNKPLSNFEIEDAVINICLKNKLLRCFLERHFAKETKTK